MDRIMIGVDEFATAVGLSRPKAYEVVNSNGFPKIRVGRRILIPVASLQTWLAEQAAQGAQLTTKGS